MINATLCSTSREEPWAANVDFEVQGATWTTTLSTAYAHYQNVVVNESVVVVYKTQGFEMIAKGSARLDEPADDGTALATPTRSH